MVNHSAATLSMHCTPVTLWICPQIPKTQQWCVNKVPMSLPHWSITYIFQVLLAYPLRRITVSGMCTNSDSYWNRRSLHYRKARETHYLSYHYIFQTHSFIILKQTSSSQFITTSWLKSLIDSCYSEIRGAKNKKLWGWPQGSCAWDGLSTEKWA